jgi:hypothetical protein
MPASLSLSRREHFHQRVRAALLSGYGSPMPGTISNPTASLRSHVRRLAVAALCAAVTVGVAAGSATSAASAFSPEHKCKPRGYSAYEFVSSVTGTPPKATVRARIAQVICGGPDDSHWYPVGPVRTVRLSPAVTVALDRQGSTSPKPATFADFVKLMRLQLNDKRFAWWGAGFGMQINSRPTRSAR